MMAKPISPGKARELETTVVAASQGVALMTSTKDPDTTVSTDEALTVSLADADDVHDAKFPDQLARAGRAGWKLTAFGRSIGTVVRNPIIVALYLVLGMLVYSHTQVRPCGPQDIAELEAAGCFGLVSECTNCVMPWTYTDSIYFAMATISTCAHRPLRTLPIADAASLFTPPQRWRRRSSSSSGPPPSLSPSSTFLYVRAPCAVCPPSLSLSLSLSLL